MSRYQLSTVSRFDSETKKITIFLKRPHDGRKMKVELTEPQAIALKMLIEHRLK